MTATAAATGVPPAARLRTLALVVLTAVAIAAAAWYVEQPTADGVTAVDIAPAAGAAPRAGAVAPDFETAGVAGGTLRLSDYAGKPVWLTFGASWCGDCRAEAPDLQATYDSFRAQGLVVLGVFIQEDAATVREYAERVGFTFPMTADPSARIAAAYHTLGIPTHFFIGPDGVIRQVRIGALDLADMEQLVRELLG